MISRGRTLSGWLLLAAVLTLLVKLALDTLDSGLAGWVLPIIAVPACVLVSIPLHEGGHLLAALVTRLKIIETRIRYAEPAYVRVTTDPGSPLLPLRFVLFHLAGPAVNVLLAAGLSKAGTADLPMTVRECALMAAFASGLIGLLSLLPQRLGTLHSDGTHVLRWLFRPARARAAASAGGANPAPAVIPGLPELHRMVVDGRPVDPQTLARLAATASALAGGGGRPRDHWHLVARAIVELRNDRPADARRILLGIAPSAEPDVTAALLIRVVAATALGDTAQAERVLTALRAAHDRAGRPDGAATPPAENLIAQSSEISG
ncbi:hypothetical protein ACTI_61930 [Actinoplanes sp. OR16]|uniref:hypothetical protein n=1 Tax=Actinoplanes sp. OR16 TaxID=946334 RepID=UPI000F71364F|nr:hypothetical protein [Actinoplanes sp. OR16]BBH69508.1 hypothetical protein ACTI_61930 [Actinoplanes sp. OR16]